MKTLRFRKSIFLMLVVFFLSMNANASIALASSNESNGNDKVLVEIMINNNGDDFANHVIFDDGTKLSDYDYTVVYKPMPRNYVITSSYEITNYFDYAAWITRDGVISLSLDPKPEVREHGSIKNSAWDVLSSSTKGFGSHKNWKNTQVMKWQFDCHFQWAPFKDYWNLEPHRTASSYAEVVLNGCNP